MILKTKLALAATAGVAALALSACGGTAADFMYSSGTAKAYGTVNLDNYDPNFTSYFGFAPGAQRTVPTGGTSSAKVNLVATYNGGNWNVSGSWSDGDVRFNVKGWALECIYGGNGCDGVYGSSLRHDGTHSGGGSTPGTVTITGGMCLPVLTHYVSTNSARPGTGWAEFAICDNGAPWSSSLNKAGVHGTSLPGTDWSGPDYVEVFIPDSQQGDLNPFANYLSGGTMTGYKSSTFAQVTFLQNSPSYSPTPSWGPPSGTGTSSTSSTPS